MKKILILENGKSISNMISHLCQAEDYKIISSENCLTKESKMPKQIPDMVIADLTSITNEKVELLIHLKSNSVMTMVPFLLITSENDVGGQERFSLLNYKLKKPFRRDELFAAVKKIISHMDNVSPW